MTDCDIRNVGSLAYISEYMSREDNGLVQIKEHRDITLTVNYIPDYFRTLQEVGYPVRDTSEFLKTFDNIKGHHYFLLRVASNKPNFSLNDIVRQGGREWPQVQSELEYNLGSRFTLFEGDQVIACSLYQPFYGVKPSLEIQFLLVFKHSENWSSKSKLTLRFKDEYFYNELWDFDFSAMNIDQIPELELLTRR